MGRLFGTDGVRGVANRDLTPDLALALGRAAGLVLRDEGTAHEVIVGRDTRLSGPMLQAALTAGLCSAGIDVRHLGIVPTPAVAFVTVDESAMAGAMVSASHNPVPDNGIKFFSEEGSKLPGDIEDAIEKALSVEPVSLPEAADVGTASHFPEGVDRYRRHLLDSIDGGLDGSKVVLDCAFGAAWELAPAAFRDAGTEVIAMHDEPDGARINVECGSTSLSLLSRRVVEEGADLGFAFDGDADRVLACDETGAAVDGDRIIALSALRLHDMGALKNDVVVGTVMANLGFRRALEERGIEVIQAPVGDKFVVEAMIESGAMLGGEQSGHIVFAEHGLTGDGILAALQVARAVASSQERLSALAHVYETVPQVLINVSGVDRERLADSARLWAKVAAIEERLGDEGRVLLRPSGTEPIVRVMVEALDPEVAERVARELADDVKAHLS